jgi:type II secretion system protein C
MEKLVTLTSRFINLLIVSAIFYLLAKSTISFISPSSAWVPLRLDIKNSESSLIPDKETFKFEVDPFNRKLTDGPITQMQIVQDAPETTLNLVLTGMISGPNGIAILKKSDEKQRSYKVGELIYPGVVLQSVQKNYIIIDVDGKIQRLTFNREEITGLSYRNDDLKSNKGLNKESLVTRSSDFDVDLLFQNLSLRRVSEAGKLRGYSIKQNQPNMDLTKLGFLKEDIITAIDGVDITSGSPNFVKLFEQSRKSGNVVMTIIRNGKTKKIKIGMQS